MKRALTPLERWDKSVLLYLKPWLDEPSAEWILGRFRRNTHLFLKGDLVLCDLWNGQAQRLLVTGLSGKGYGVKRLYQSFQRWKGEEGFPGVVQVLERPERLATCTPDAPDIRDWIASVSVQGIADSAGGVDAGSPSLSLKR